MKQEKSATKLKTAVPQEISPLSSEGKEALGKNQGPTTENGSSNDDPLVSGLSRLVMVRGETKSGFLKVEGKIRGPVRLWIHLVSCYFQPDGETWHTTQ